ncbi:MAG TPA: HEAT repeat domain-containing protein [Bacteroidota bacterium]|nr:HEAT repeat domain-containing protein [Bacteroidota bacterium]
MLRTVRFAVGFIPVALFCAGAAAQTVIRPPESTAGLNARWQWAAGEAVRRPAGCWVGYVIQKKMGRHSFIGRWDGDRDGRLPTLGEILGVPIPAGQTVPEGLGSGTTCEGSFTFGGSDSDSQVLKEIGILFHLPGGGRGKVDNAVVSNISLHVDLGGGEILWLGAGSQEESIDLLRSVYAQTSSEEARKTILLAAGCHTATDRVLGFLASVLTGSGESSLREEAAFWMGETNGSGAGALLEEAARHDRSESVREKAVFALSLLNDSAGTEALVRLASEKGDRDMRKNAAFWLGQRATRKAVASLHNIAMGDDDFDVEESALFALTQLPDNNGIDPLIAIARNHADPRIRKKAIFWLSQSDDPRALEAIEAIVRN